MEQVVAYVPTREIGEQVVAMLWRRFPYGFIVASTGASTPDMQLAVMLVRREPLRYVDHALLKHYVVGVIDAMCLVNRIVGFGGNVLK